MGDSYGASRGGWAIVSHDTQDHCVRPQWAQCPCLPRGGDEEDEEEEEEEEEGSRVCSAW